MKLPDSLLSSERALLLALSRPMLAEWPEGTPYTDADQPTAVASVIIKPLHEHLTNARVRHLFREKLSKKAGQASRAGAKLAYLADVDFIVEYDWTIWRQLSAEQRIALVDHELAHCDRDDDKWVLLDHDIEEFAAIVQRWGLWHESLRTFGHAVRHAQQLEMALGADARTAEAEEALVGAGLRLES